MSGLRGVEYLEGSTPATRYELAPSVKAVVSCLGLTLPLPLTLALTLALPLFLPLTRWSLAWACC